MHPDEAYYWSWALNPSLGYFDHPPMIAWIIRGSQWIIERFVPEDSFAASKLFFSQIGFRFLPYFITGVLVPLILGRTLEIVQRAPIGMLQMLILISSPIFFFGPLIVTPDSVFFLGWALCFYCSVRFLRHRRPDSIPGDRTPWNLKLASLAGFSLAFAAYSKYSALLAAFLMILTGAGVRNTLFMGLMSFVLFLPHLLWNLSTGLKDGAGIFFQFQNATGFAFKPVEFKRMGDLWAAQILLWNPFIFFGCFSIALTDLRRLFVSQKKSQFTGSLFLWAMAPLFFFTITSFSRPAEVNWALVGVMGAQVLVLSRIRNKFSLKSLFLLFNLITIVMSFLVITQNQRLADLLEPLNARVAEKLRKPSRLIEFQDWASLRDRVFEATRTEQNYPVEVHTYQNLSELLFYDSVTSNDQKLGGRLKIWADGSRRSQYHLSPEYILPLPKGARYLVARSDERVPAECRSVQILHKGISDPRSFTVYRCGF